MHPNLYTPKFTSVNGINLAYTEHGPETADTLLFIHGLGENMQTWFKNIEGLSSSYHCIALDLPGHGLSQTGDYPYTPFFFSEIISIFIKQLGFSSVNLIGHSLGGQIAIILAITQPTLIEKIVLISTAGFEIFTDKDKRWIKEHSNNYINPLKSFDLLSLWSGNKGTANNVFKAVVAGMLDQPVFDHLHLLTQPVLVIFGEEDPFIPNRFLHRNLSPKAVAESGSHKIPGAILKMIELAGHFVQIERVGEVNGEITKFISN